MRKKYLWIFLMSFLTLSCCQIITNENIDLTKQNVIIPTEKIELWNGKDFSNWITFSPDTNVDVNSVWSVQENIIHCSGNPVGYIRTKENYANYKLIVTWRWPTEPGNSGVLLHAQSPDLVWPKCIEAQLMSGDAGDFYVINGTDFTELIDKNSRRLAKQKSNSEKPIGQWNKYEIICKNNSIELFVNRVFQNKATNCTVQSGTIGFQSEGKPIQFKEIYLEPIDY